MKLRRFVTYIYCYEQGKRGKNMGFIKADMRESGCRMEIQVRGQERMAGRGRVCLIVSGEEGDVAVPVGEMMLGAGGGRMKLLFNRNILGESGYTADRIRAVAIRCDGGKLLISCWAENVSEDVLNGRFRILGEAGEKEEIQRGNRRMMEESPGALRGIDEMPEPQGMAGDGLMSDGNEELTGAEQESDGNAKPGGYELTSDGNEELTEKELAPNGDTEPGGYELTSDGNEKLTGDKQASDGNEEPAEEAGDRQTKAWVVPGTGPEDVCGSQGEVSDVSGGRHEPKTDYRRIEITDIRKLPKSNWHLCSNSFLIHGFFNYHYLMLKTVEADGQKSSWIGVPGIYEQPERMMALMFGFPEFEKEHRGREGNAPTESCPNGIGVFGYWMCRLSS